MKTVLLQLLTTLVILAIYSCSKTNTEAALLNNTEDILLVGNWNVVNDSSSNTNAFYTLQAGDSGIISNNYNGEQCGATFNFGSNGYLVTSFYDCVYGFGSTIDSAKYVVTNNQVTISIYAQGDCCSFTHFNPVITRTYAISNLTANTATLTFSLLLGGKLAPGTEIINLKK